MNHAKPSLGTPLMGPDPNNQISNQITQLSLFLPVAGKAEKLKPLVGLEKLVDSFSEKLSEKKSLIEGNLREISSSAKNQQKKLEELAALIEARRNETDAQLSQWQQQFSEAQERRSNEYTEQKSKVENQILEWREQYISAQGERAKTFDRWLDEAGEGAEAELASLIESFKDNISKKIGAFRGQMEAALKDSDIKRRAILELYELAAGDSVAGGYLESAIEEGRAANLWRRTSIAFIVGTIVWLLVAVFGNLTLNDEGNVIWAKVILAFSLTGVMLFGSAYSAQQSTRHRNTEKRTRWFALEVKAIDPFISSLPKEIQQDLKKELSNRLFGNDSYAAEEVSKVIDEHALKVVVSSITEILKTVPKG